MSLRRGLALIALVLPGCILHAADFLPRTGPYVYTALDLSPDGGLVQREELFRVFVVTSERGTQASIEMVTDAGASAGWVEPDAGLRGWSPMTEVGRASMVLVDPDSGELVDDDAPPHICLPKNVVVGSVWRTNPGRVDSCAIQGRVASVIGNTAQVTYDLMCGTTTAPLVQMSWETGRGLVETRSPDGGNVVRFAPE